jgi:hypothetical protein
MDGCGKCWKCEDGRGCIHTVSISPSATPSRRNTIAPRTPDPAWERGIPVDRRGMPQLDETGAPMHAKKYAEKRSQIDEAKRKARNAPAAI